MDEGRVPKGDPWHSKDVSLSLRLRDCPLRLDGTGVAIDVLPSMRGVPVGAVVLVAPTTGTPDMSGADPMELIDVLATLSL